MRAALVSAGLTAMLGAWPSSVQPQARPDCSAAATRAEQLVCSDAQLAALERLLEDYYAEALHAFAESSDCLLADQSNWLRSTGETCVTAECLQEAYLNRLAEFQAVQPEVSALTQLSLPDRPALRAVIPPNGDADMLPPEPSRELKLQARYSFDPDYGMSFTDDEGRRFVASLLLNQSVPDELAYLEKQKRPVLVRGKVLQTQPSEDSYPGIPPPHAEFDQRACIFVYQ